MSGPFDAHALRDLLAAYGRLLATHEDEINALNVYPVADGDTGTNMLSTVAGVVDAIGDVADGETIAEVRSRAAQAVLRSARGSSGIIFCQWLRAFLAALPEDQAGAASVSHALGRAADAAYGAVEAPVEGTMLTVARAAAEAVSDATDLPSLWRLAARAADGALVRTPDLLPVLAEAGVVDSGARALTLLFDSADGHPPEEVPVVAAVPAAQTATGPPDRRLTHEVTLLLDATSAGPLLAAWQDLGEAIVVAGDGSDGGWRCHIHTDDVDGVIVAARRNGGVTDVRVEELPGPCSDPGAPAPNRDGRTGAVAVTAGLGLAARLRELGAVVVRCAKTMNASIGEVAEAIDAAPGESVVVLPGDPDTLQACEAACRLAERTARVLPATSLASTLACMERHDSRLDLDADLAVMRDALDDPWIEVAEVARDAHTRVGEVSAGEWIVIGPEGILHAASDPIEAARLGLARLDGDDLEVYPGLQADPARTDSLLALLREARPGCGVILRDGGQPWQAWLVRVPQR